MILAATTMRSMRCSIYIRWVVGGKLSESIKANSSFLSFFLLLQLALIVPLRRLQELRQKSRPTTAWYVARPSAAVDAATGLSGWAHAFGLTESHQKAFCESGGSLKVCNAPLMSRPNV